MKEVKKAIIVANGKIENLAQIKQNISTLGFSCPDLIISADGGAKNTLLLGLLPQTVIGDMDSIDPETKAMLQNKKTTFVQESPSKDYTDTHLAVREAVGQGAEKIIILGAVGGRTDHELANIMLLADPFLAGRDIKIISGTEEIFTVCRPATVQGVKGKQISLFSLTPYTFFTGTTGLKYKLENEKLLFSPVRGISNEFSSPQARLDISEGILLVIKQL
ncbi:MAG: thiamine diphosphokinase [Actinomycetia bacterium]|nr:thiamine diphosphokinase [Actinomycetes bacterium]